jgi:hypothetical protein
LLQPNATSSSQAYQRHEKQIEICEDDPIKRTPVLLIYHQIVVQILEEHDTNMQDHQREGPSEDIVKDIHGIFQQTRAFLCSLHESAQAPPGRSSRFEILDRLDEQLVLQMNLIEYFPKQHVVKSFGVHERYW